MHKIGKYIPWLVGLGALFLLVAHSAQWKIITVDATTLALLGVIAITPLIDKVRKIRLGDLEAEIAPREIAEIEHQASASLEDQPKTADNSFEDDVVELVQKDAVLGLAKVRIEIERLLRSIHSRILPAAPDERAPRSVVELLRDIQKTDPLPDAIVSTLKRVTSLANRAVHGERIRQEDAETMVRIGARLVEQLQHLHVNRWLEPMETKVISAKEMNEYRSATYKVTMVTPYVEDPIVTVRIMDQDGLDEILDGYGEYAEFIVAVEIVGSH